jgi:hypothetical protein
MRKESSCYETLATARGDERDGPDLRTHLAHCPDCRHQVEELRLLVRRAQSELLSASTASELGAIRARLERHRSERWTGLAWAAAVAAGLAALSLAIPLGRPGPEPAMLGQRPDKVTIEFAQPAGNRLPYVLHGPQGDRHGALDIPPQYVLETVPVNAVVVDTF